DLGAHVAELRPVDELARRQHVAEATIDPDEGALVVLEIEHAGALGEDARLDDDVELLVHEPRRAQAHDIDAHAPQRIEEPVPAGVEQTTKLAVAEVQADLVAMDLDDLEELQVDHGAPRIRIINHRDTEAQRRQTKNEKLFPLFSVPLY